MRRSVVAESGLQKSPMPSHPLLSICIATFMRAAFIAETLDSIVPLLSDDVALLVVDGASPDDTESVMRRYIERHPEVIYFRQAENGGVDGDYDNAVQYARGAYCRVVQNTYPLRGRCDAWLAQ
jgi:abequosyltransferase